GDHVRQRLGAVHGGLAVELLPLSTRGDEILDRRLDQAGGKGLFVKELENALADRRADVAVHSMKDVPADLPPGFVLAAIMAREDPRDALVSNSFETLASIPKGGIVGTSSLRRAAQVAERYPQLEMKLLRGNVETRLTKLDRGEYDAIILAVAGLVRLGLAGRIRSRLDVDDSLPAPGQGALGIECLDAREEVVSLLRPLNDAATARCVEAERGGSRALGGSCGVPLGPQAAAPRGACRPGGAGRRWGCVPPPLRPTAGASAAPTARRTTPPRSRPTPWPSCAARARAKSCRRLARKPLQGRGIVVTRPAGQ